MSLSMPSPVDDLKPKCVRLAYFEIRLTFTPQPHTSIAEIAVGCFVEIDPGWIFLKIAAICRYPLDPSKWP